MVLRVFPGVNRPLIDHRQEDPMDQIERIARANNAVIEAVERDPMLPTDERDRLWQQYLDQHYDGSQEAFDRDHYSDVCNSCSDDGEAERDVR